MEGELRAWWQVDVGHDQAADDAFDRLLARYREPHRRYHTVHHLWKVVTGAALLLDQVQVPDPGAVRLAAWFHDAVYDPRRADNEEASAALAGRELAALGMAPVRCDAVERLVLATATHTPRADDEAVLVDADLAVLGAPPHEYTAYARAVRAEYAHLDDSTWRDGRAAVLDLLLARPVVFTTAPMQHLEPRARANLRAERAALARAGGDEHQDQPG